MTYIRFILQSLISSFRFRFFFWLSKYLSVRVSVYPGYLSVLLAICCQSSLMSDYLFKRLLVFLYVCPFFSVSYFSESNLNTELQRIWIHLLTWKRWWSFIPRIRIKIQFASENVLKWFELIFQFGQTLFVHSQIYLQTRLGSVANLNRDIFGK